MIVHDNHVIYFISKRVGEPLSLLSHGMELLLCKFRILEDFTCLLRHNLALLGTQYVFSKSICLSFTELEHLELQQKTSRAHF